jgi:hypothetical protein
MQVFEASLSRLLSQQDDYVVGMISASRKFKNNEFTKDGKPVPYTDAENSARNDLLLVYLRSMNPNLTITKIKGYSPPAEAWEDFYGKEDSFWVTWGDPGDDGGKLEAILTHLGAIFQQDSIFIKNWGMDGEIVATTDREDGGTMSLGDRFTVGKFFGGWISPEDKFEKEDLPYFSRAGKRPFMYGTKRPKRIVTSELEKGE